MAWIKVESSVARNRKFLAAGPAASWLWLCGLAYCQEGLTDGFIPAEALPVLGVIGHGKTDPRRLATSLVLTRLWDAVEGGWRVHDYLDHNRSAGDVAEIKAKRGTGGKLGGRPKKNLPINLRDTSKVSQRETFREKTVNPYVAVADVDVAAVVVSSEGDSQGETPPCDVWLRELQAAYPPSAVSSGHLTEVAFLHEVMKFGTPEATFTAMLMNLENQKHGHQWRVKGMIPRMDRWLSDGLWRQTHEAAPVSSLVSEKTARTLTSGAAFVAGGEK